MSDEVIRKVQQKLNKLSLYTLGRLLAHCKKGEAVYEQVLLAMSPELDPARMNDKDSYEYVKSGYLHDDKWSHE